VEGLWEMKGLMFLDLSDNLIKKVEPDQLPTSLAILKFTGNICTEKDDYWRKMVANLELLDELDGVAVQVAEWLHY